MNETAEINSFQFYQIKLKQSSLSRTEHPIADPVSQSTISL